MIIEIQNFGPIKEFTYDLEKDIIITYGNNNIGKSYAMQIVYLMLKTFIRNIVIPLDPFRSSVSFLSLGISDGEEAIESSQLIKNFMESDDVTKNITKYIVNRSLGILSKTYLQEFFVSCGNTFGNFDKTVSENTKILIENECFQWEIDFCHKSVKGNINIQQINLRKTDSTFHRSRKYGNHFDIYITSDVTTPAGIVEKQIIDNAFLCVNYIKNKFANVYYLPASRSGIYCGMSAFGAIVAELSKNRAFFTKKIEFPGISEPISDYFISLSNINRIKENEILAPFYKEIESVILKGQVTFDKSKNVLLYQPDNVSAAFEMTEVSSMVSEISPIVAFLKYILSFQAMKKKQKKVILFIEEPEAHLHPNNQIALIEVFAKLSEYNVKLIMSSHSNYVFNKMNNLVLAREIDYKIYEPILLGEQEGGSVSKMLEIDDLGANDENFVDVSEKLYAEREGIIMKRNMEE